MRLLILGGTWFLGRVIAEEAIRRGHQVTTFNRGRSGPDVRGVTPARGDRENPDDLRRLFRGGSWDALVDTGGYVPRDVLGTARLAAGAVSRYAFVSTVSVYTGWPVVPLHEESELLDCPPDAGPGFGADDRRGYPTGYGIRKAGCERAVLEVYGEQTLILRPGVVLGPHEYVGRLPWWLRRVQRGGEVLAPGRPERLIQPVDVRDVAVFTLDVLGAQRGGAFNVTAPVGHDTYGGLLRACAEVTGSDARFVWVGDRFLTQQGVREWTELPLWRTHPGTWRVSSEHARSAGLHCRPLRETVAATWDWLGAHGQAANHERSSQHGMDPERERALLTRWQARTTGQ